MKVLITGATGFVGKHLVPKLLKNHDVYEITIEPALSQLLYNGKIHSFHFTGIQKDLVKFVEEIKPDAVIHLASFLTSSDDFQDVEKLIIANIKFLLNILDSLKNISPKLFINTGTFAEYFNNDEKFDPAYIYAATKTASRSFLKYYSGAYNFRFITVVPFSIYGGQDTQKKLLDYLIESSEKEIDFTAGEQLLDFVHVEDVADAYCKIIDNEKYIVNGDTFYIGTGKGTSIRQLASLIEAVLGKKLNINWGARPYRKRDVMKAVAPVALNNISIGWKPSIDLMNGIKKMVSK
jgi:nucleoside-diphosphate-sugar epimerase